MYDTLKGFLIWLLIILRIYKLKSNGLKTELAFEKVLNLAKNTYDEVLLLEKLSDDELEKYINMVKYKKDRSRLLSFLWNMKNLLNEYE